MAAFDTSEQTQGSARLPKRVLYVGPFRFPNGDAGAQRVLGIGRALKAGGIDVEFCGWSKAVQTLTGTEAGDFEGFRFRNLPEFRSGNEAGFKRVLHHIFEGKLTLDWLKQNANSNDVVVLYNWYGMYAAKAIAWCRSRGVPVIVDSVEWYDPHQCAGGPFGLVRWEVDWCLQRVFRRADGIFAISSFLMKHFSSTTPTLRVPPLVDARNEKWRRNEAGQSDGKINIAYCGIPGRKDNLSHLFEALAHIRERDDRFQVTLIGPERNQVESALGGPAVTKFQNVVFRGRLAHVDAIDALGAAHYSLLIRPDRRYAHAGFSTKFVESLAIGTPPFCNVTSDIAEYTRDGLDSIHVRTDSTEDVLTGLRRIMTIDFVQHSRMRLMAKESAAREFDWHNFVEPISQFVRSRLIAKN